MLNPVVGKAETEAEMVKKPTVTSRRICRERRLFNDPNEQQHTCNLSQTARPPNSTNVSIAIDTALSPQPNSAKKNDRADSHRPGRSCVGDDGSETQPGQPLLNLVLFVTFAVGIFSVDHPQRGCGLEGQCPGNEAPSR